MKKINNQKTFCIYDLLPEDYSFDWKAFESDPDRYEFTEDDILYLNAIELNEYENKTSMTAYEKRALRRWVASGHSVREAPPSKYPCVYPAMPEPDFLEIYRTDRELDKATKGMSEEEKLVYLRNYAGFTEDSFTDSDRQEVKESV